jgi:hypothetical protein
MNGFLIRLGVIPLQAARSRDSVRNRLQPARFAWWAVRKEVQDTTDAEAALAGVQAKCDALAERPILAIRVRYAWLMSRVLAFTSMRAWHSERTPLRRGVRCAHSLAIFTSRYQEAKMRGAPAIRWP